MKTKSTSALVPAAARGTPLLSTEEAELNSQAIETFLRAVGGRTELTDVLAIGAAGGDLDKVTQLLLDPRYAGFSLKRLCGLAGITVVDLLASYKKALIARAHIEATYVIAGKIVPVVRDVMDRALPQPILCSLCQGQRTVNAVEPGQPPVACPACKGQGTVLSEPTVERHKLALELGQLTEKKGGIVMQQNTIAAGVAASATQTGALEQLQQAVGDLLFAPKRKGGSTATTREEPPVDYPYVIEEPDLPFGDPRQPTRDEPPPRRRPDLPGEPEEGSDDDDDPTLADDGDDGDDQEPAM